MRLFCIKSSTSIHPELPVPLVQKGHIYNSIEYREGPNFFYDGQWTKLGVYKLAETGEAIHCEDLFIPVEEDQIDETELVKERKLQTSKT